MAWRKYAGRFPPKEAKEKAARYCAYQERSFRQVRQKLKDLGLYPDEVEEVLSELILDDFVNEERFARAYARGHFYMKQWGRRKIVQGLRTEDVSQRNIDDALTEVDPEDYTTCLQQLADKKYGELQGLHPMKKRARLTSYLVQKGYEPDLVRAQVSRLVG